MNCHRCGAGVWNPSGNLWLSERWFVFRWYVWQTYMENREGAEGNPDPRWDLNPITVLRVMWRGLRPKSVVPDGEAKENAKHGAEESGSKAVRLRTEP